MFHQDQEYSKPANVYEKFDERIVCKGCNKWKDIISAYPMGNGRDDVFMYMFHLCLC
jgi:hypothetical protein